MGQSQLRHAQNVPRRSPQQAPTAAEIQHFLFGALLPYDGPLLPPPPLLHLFHLRFHVLEILNITYSGRGPRTQAPSTNTTFMSGSALNLF